MYVCLLGGFIVRFPAQKQELGIASFGVSVTTMEEVFMKVGEDADRGLDTRSAQNICIYTCI